MDDEPWRIRRRREPESPVRKTERFVKVPWWWIEPASKHIRSPATLVLLELLYQAWQKGATFPLPSERLMRLGVSREIKRRVLRDLERGGLILVERSSSKAPVVTLIGF